MAPSNVTASPLRDGFGHRGQCRGEVDIFQEAVRCSYTSMDSKTGQRLCLRHRPNVDTGYRPPARVVRGDC